MQLNHDSSQKSARDIRRSFIANSGHSHRALADRKLRWWRKWMRAAEIAPNGWCNQACHLPKQAPTRGHDDLVAQANADELGAISDCVYSLREPYQTAVLVRHRLSKKAKPDQRIYDRALDLLIDMFRRRHVVLIE